VIPVLPLPAMAAPVATAPVNAMQLGWAALFARTHNCATPELLQTWLRVGPEQAQALMSEMVKRNIIHTPVAGTAAAVQPMYTSSGIPGMRPTLRKVADAAKDAIKDMMHEDTEAAEVTIQEDETDLPDEDEVTDATS